LKGKAAARFTRRDVSTKLSAGGDFVIRPWSIGRRQQPWLAVAAAYLVALQLVLAGFASVHFGIVEDSSSGTAIVTCLGHSLGVDGQGAPGQVPVDQATCPLCTLATGGCGVLPVVPFISVIAVAPAAQLISARDDQVVRRDIRTGRHQRGPPSAHFIAA
jgi:hypothetical protein